MSVSGTGQSPIGTPPEGLSKRPRKSEHGGRLWDPTRQEDKENIEMAAQAALSSSARSPENTPPSNQLDQWRLGTDDVRLKSLKCSIFPDQQDEYQRLVKEIRTLRDGVSLPSSERVDQIHGRVQEFEANIVERLSQELGVSTDIAKRIFDGAASNWAGFIEREQRPDGPIAIQKHGIKGLKIYYLPGTETLVADFSRQGEIGKGSSKRAKSTVRMEPSGVVEIVRLTSLTKGASEFTEDVQKELQARKELFDAKVPNIADMTVIRYINSRGQEKVRFFMKRYPSDVSGLIRREEQDTALNCCLDAVTAFKAMHQAGLMHFDVKGENILVDGTRGYLSDFGNMKKRGTMGGPSYCGMNTIYRAPEVVANVPLGPGVDMFSFGMLLLRMVDPNCFEQWRYDVPQFIMSDKCRAMDIYKEKHKALIEYLGQMATMDDRYTLIRDLLSFEPDKRPPAEETERQMRQWPTSDSMEI